MSGSQAVHLGALACSGGVGAGKKAIADLNCFMDENGYKDMDSLYGDALKLFHMPKEAAEERQEKLGEDYRLANVSDACIGCGRCVDVCWHDGIRMKGRLAEKTEQCIGCGCCLQICPTGVLHMDKERILASVFEEKNIRRGE